MLTIETKNFNDFTFPFSSLTITMIMPYYRIVKTKILIVHKIAHIHFDIYYL
jgi:hypothetical protein